MIIRSWRCQNKNCLHEFDAGNENPKCPKCGCIRTQWVPKPVALGRSASQIDRVVRELATDFKMTNVPTVRRGQAVKQASVMRQGPVGKLAGREIPLDRVSNFKTGAKVGGSLGVHVGGNVAPLRAATSIVGKADRY